MMLRTLAVVLSLCSMLTAQEGREGEESTNIERKMRAARERAARTSGFTEAEIEGMSKEEIDKLTAANAHREPVLTSSPMCRFVAQVKPNKLMPGQSGTMRVTAILTGAAVLPAPAPVERLGMETQGLVHLGPVSFRPAEVGRGLAPAFVGRPVYDNTAVFEIPVTMAANAEVGKKQPINVDLKFELFDGATGQAIGKFLDRAVADVEVGQAADPVVRAAAKPTQPVEVPAEPVVANSVQPEKAPAKKADHVLTAQPTVPVPEATPPAPTASAERPSAEPMMDGGDGAPIVPIAIGGGLLLLVIVMLVARKK